MKKYNFNKLLNARQKAHDKRIKLLDKGLTFEYHKLNKKIDNLSEIIMNEIENI